MRTFAALAALAAAVALAGCGSDDEEAARPTGASMQTIEIGESEFKLQPATVTVDDPGVYTFHAVNNGSTDHALEIEGEGVEAETETIAPGESADLEVTLEKGTYEMYCPVGDHEDRGMKGSVAVGGAAPAGTTGTDESGDDDSGYGSYG